MLDLVNLEISLAIASLVSLIRERAKLPGNVLPLLSVGLGGLYALATGVPLEAGLLSGLVASGGVDLVRALARTAPDTPARR